MSKSNGKVITSSGKMTGTRRDWTDIGTDDDTPSAIGMGWNNDTDTPSAVPTTDIDGNGSSWSMISVWEGADIVPASWSDGQTTPKRKTEMLRWTDDDGTERTATIDAPEDNDNGKRTQQQRERYSLSVSVQQTPNMRSSGKWSVNGRPTWHRAYSFDANGNAVPTGKRSAARPANSTIAVWHGVERIATLSPSAAPTLENHEQPNAPSYHLAKSGKAKRGETLTAKGGKVIGRGKAKAGRKGERKVRALALAAERRAQLESEARQALADGSAIG